jgi:hypothetical protein
MVELFICLLLFCFVCVCRYGMISILAEEINGGENDLVRSVATNSQKSSLDFRYELQLRYFYFIKPLLMSSMQWLL